MRFDKISIRNMRLVGDSPIEIDFSPNKNVVILLGDNGMGKTTILDALATSMAPFSAQFPGVQDFQLSDLDVHIQDNGQRSEFLSVSSVIEDEGRMISSVRYRKGTTNTPKSNYEELKQMAIEKKSAILNGAINVKLPVFAYYGTGRGQFKVPERKRGFQQAFERWDCYKSAINPETDFKRFFGWFDLMEDEERRTREKLRDFDYQSPVLQSVRFALSQFVKQYHNPRIETRPLRFVMDKNGENGKHSELRIEQLSEGYKIVIAMVADLAARMAEANPSMDNPLESPGIVLIDEIDLHLHPRWQREIITQLTNVFKNIQFIVTTHSPIIVIGASEVAQVVNLNRISEDNCDTATEDLTKSNIGLVLLSDLFSLRSLQSPYWDAKISERDHILSKPEINEQDRARLKTLDEELDGVTSLFNVNVQRTDMLIEKLAQQLDIKL